MRAIEISALSKEHEGLAVGFDCPAEIEWVPGGPVMTMGDGTRREINTWLEWTYKGRNDLEDEPEVGLFHHIYQGLWIKLDLEARAYSGRMVWIEESPTERLIENVSKYLKSLEHLSGAVTVCVVSEDQGTMNFPREMP